MRFPSLCFPLAQSPQPLVQTGPVRSLSSTLLPGSPAVKEWAPPVYLSPWLGLNLWPSQVQSGPLSSTLVSLSPAVRYSLERSSQVQCSPSFIMITPHRITLQLHGLSAADIFSYSFSSGWSCSLQTGEYDKLVYSLIILVGESRIVSQMGLCSLPWWNIVPIITYVFREDLMCMETLKNEMSMEFPIR